MSSDTLTQAEERRIVEEEAVRIKEEDEKAAERELLRLAADQEAKVSYLVDSSCKLNQYVFPID